MRSVTLDSEVLRSKDGIEVGDYTENQISFLMPKLVRSGNLVTLECTLELLDHVHPLPITGKVSSCALVATGEYNVTIALRQVEKLLWAKFLKITHDNQIEADRLFKSMKGDQ